ncbi:hypothetical protein FOS14_23595 [Skermania sp. ID1734]|uniref:YveK family protein n=1 Tax=Skermania sp. ID1734 TaxID=2597516 RepID=UPI00117E9BAC|nr:Wzz/FepE/Etk N-terminal domain-containing protein [Skermania sp. ID1734]TSD93183.1 hypothetical protein FOS14_23595 [Skermania sp. ID1734]
MTLAALLRALRQGWAVIVAATAVGTLAAFGYSQLAPTVYQASARIYIRADQDLGGTSALAGQLFATNRLRTYAELAATSTVLHSAIELHKLNVTESDLAHRMLVSSPADSALLDISVRAASEHDADNQANAVATELANGITALENANGATGLQALVVDPAAPPAARVEPLKRRNMLLGVVIGLELGCAAAVIRDHRKRASQAAPIPAFAV